MTTNSNKKHHLQLLKQKSMGENSSEDELLRYSWILQHQLEWEIRDQYLELMEEFLKENIFMPEFFAELRIKNYSIIDAIRFLQSHRILLSPEKKSSKFGELLEAVTDHLEGDLYFTGDEFKNLSITQIGKITGRARTTIYKILKEELNYIPYNRLVKPEERDESK
jgi:hypothetical protein